MTEETVEVSVDLVKDLADEHKDVARYGYKQNEPEMADQHHSWARNLNEKTDRDWEEVGTDE